MRIAFLGNFGTANFGNDASLEAMIAGLRATAPSAELSCICPNPAGVMERYGVATIGLLVEPSESRTMRILQRLSLGNAHRIRTVFAAFVRMRRFDVVVVPGTGLLDDFRDRPGGWPFMLLRWCLAARLRGARLALVSLGAGPIVHPTIRRMTRATARLCCYRSYRDDVSREFMRSIGLDVANDLVFPDLAFALPSPPKVARDTEGPLTIGVGVMTYLGWVAGDPQRDEAIYSSYVDRLADLVDALVTRKCRVRLMMGDASDAKVIEDLQGKLNSTRRQGTAAALISDPASDIHDVLRQMADCDLVVATRYHNVVAALMLERPTVSLEYSGKNAALMDAFGLGGFCHHVERFEVDDVIADLDRLNRDRVAHAEIIATRLAETRAALDEQYRAFAERVLRLPAPIATSPDARVERSSRPRVAEGRCVGGA